MDANKKCPHCAKEIQDEALRLLSKAALWFVGIGAVLAVIFAIGYTPEVVSGAATAQGSHSSLPSCDSQRGLADVMSTFNDSPSKNLDPQIVEITQPQTVAATPTRVDCQATAVFSSGAPEGSPIHYSFRRAERGKYLVSAGPEMGLLGPPATEEQRTAQAAKDCKDNAVFNANLIAVYRNVAALAPDKATADADRKAADAIAASCP